MKLLTILLLLIGSTAFAQTNPQDSVPPPHPDSAVISLNQVNAIIAKIRQEWNMNSAEPAIGAFQMLVELARSEYRKRKQLQSKNPKK